MLCWVILILFQDFVITAPHQGFDEDLKDVFIAVKTSSQFYASRLPPLLDTWFPQARDSTWLFSDKTNDEETKKDEERLVKKTGGHLVITDCPSDHSRDALCCKMEAELMAFLTSPKKERWFCHLDDDNYLNTPALLALLSNYRSDRDWYLGKASISNPLEILDQRNKDKKSVSFMFGTGGAGFCLSRPVVEKMRVETFSETGNSIRLPDDVTVGYLVEVVLGVLLTKVDSLHSHLEPLHRVRKESLGDQVTLSYSTYQDTGEHNMVDVEGIDVKVDPTSFYLIHCLLFPRLAKDCDKFLNIK